MSIKSIIFGGLIPWAVTDQVALIEGDDGVLEVLCLVDQLEDGEYYKCTGECRCWSWLGVAWGNHKVKIND